jgi:hypothetical protein
MRVMKAVLVVVGCALVTIATAAWEQSPATQPGAVAPAPTLIPISGELRTPTGEPRTGPVALVISLYGERDDAAPIWLERQDVTLDQFGRYAIAIGASQSDGIPADIFLAGLARWVGVGIEGESEQPRFMLLTVPYALRAREADTLGGRTASEFVTVTGDSGGSTTTKAAAEGGEGTDPTIQATVNKIPKFTSSGGAIDDSNMIDVSGNIGIGLTSPLARLHVSGSVRVQGGGSVTSPTLQVNHDDMGFFGPAVNTLAAVTTSVERMRITAAGDVGIGTTSPLAKLQVNGTIRSGGGSATAPGLQVNHDDMGLFAPALNTLGFATNSVERFRISSTGNVGIGTTAPSTKLHVAGDVTIDGNIAAKYQDVAEWVETVEPIANGTVVIVDPNRSNHVVPSDREYDTRVAGAVSPQPGLILGDKGDNKVMVAQSGRVRIKVDATFGPIAIGDLLVTSPTAGHAMRSEPVRVGDATFHRSGTLVGKALEPLANGRGEILVLLTLQ